MDSNKVFSELKLIWSNTLSIGSTPSPKKQSLSISSAENIAGCDEQKSRGGQKYSSPFSSSCRIYRSAKVVQRIYKTLWKACAKVLQVLYKYKNKYVQGYSRSLPSTAVVQNLYETCTRLQYSVCRNEAASIRNGSAKTLCSADLRYATHAN